MDKTINQLKSELQEIATQHKQINSFFFGSFHDAINRDAVDYRLMTATLQPGSIDENVVNVSLVIVVADKYNVDDFRVTDEVHSDCLQILRDIYITFKQTRLEQYIDIEGTVSKDPFINRGADVTAGWSMTMNLSIYDNGDWCSIPYTSYDFENDN